MVVFKSLLGGVCLCWALAQPAVAAPSMALGYTPKYKPGFSHFDYVNPQAPKGGQLLLPGFGGFDSLNPFVLRSEVAGGITELMFETLTEQSLDEPFSAYGLLAEDMALAPDRLSVTFRLNPKARFSNGDPVTAADVKFSFDTLKSDAAHPRYRFYWGDIKNAEALDARTVRFNFVKINPELHMLAGQIPVFSKKWLAGKPLNKVALETPIGSGPYTIEKYALGKNISFKRNPEYWGRDLPTRRGMYNFDRVALVYYKDDTVQVEGLKAGEFDFMFVTNSKQWARDFEGPRFASGEIKKTELKHRNNAGMQGFIFNIRKPYFADRRVRRAITLAFDFEWSNRNLFYNQYTRCDSYFSNSELASRGIPQGDELSLLAPYRDKLPPELFTRPWQPPRTAPPHSLRNNLLEAKKLLEQAGWKVSNGALRNAQGQPLEFQVLLAQKGFERIMAPFAANLAKLGIRATYRTVDTALYQRREETRDFDMLVESFGQSQSPGNEQFNMWHSSVADKEGSGNYIGIKDPVVDAMIEKVIYAPDRKALVTATRALDRVLLHGEYLVPNWYSATHRIAYWDKFGFPKTLPLYYAATEWVIKTAWDKRAKPSVASRVLPSRAN